MNVEGVLRRNMSTPGWKLDRTPFEREGLRSCSSWMHVLVCRFSFWCTWDYALLQRLSFQLNIADEIFHIQ